MIVSLSPYIYQMPTVRERILKAHVNSKFGCSILASAESKHVLFCLSQLPPFPSLSPPQLKKVRYTDISKKNSNPAASKLHIGVARAAADQLRPVAQLSIYVINETQQPISLNQVALITACVLIFYQLGTRSYTSIYNHRSRVMSLLDAKIATTKVKSKRRRKGKERKKKRKKKK